MGGLAAAVNYTGALDLNAYFTSGDETSQPQHDLSQVSGIYSPGTFFTWLLVVNTYMRDEYYYTPSQPKSVAPWLDKSPLRPHDMLRADGIWRADRPSLERALWTVDGRSAVRRRQGLGVLRQHLRHKDLARLPCTGGALPVSNVPRKPAPYIY
ncbi:hypothetical protein K505DRAFT_416425 [Melanomma pulvis-pyrius CBS 109.77]|uniref:Uncharacterized protein n=1 Tax=Melanomma pulvis-pyrius CBS 109.77 TaxID=1314802 RepID=A0A6A6XH28_9PLEO|nr:hypothetical protein K505DRAFT_416425 [Melanomma pulvis-pyrius CBS 109.77]